MLIFIQLTPGFLYDENISMLLFAGNPGLCCTG